MNEVECWIYLDGPEPERLGQLLDAMRELPPLTPEEEERLDGRAMAAIDAWLDGANPPPSGVPPTRGQGGLPPPSANLPPVSSSAADSRHSQPPSQPLAGAPAPPASIAAAATPEAPRSSGVALSRPAPPGASRAPKTLELPVMRVEVKDTAPLGDNRIAVLANAFPFPSSQVGPATVHIPQMSLEQFAAFQAELAFWPTHHNWVRHRHQVPHEAAHRALDEHWRKHFAAHPEDGPAYSRAYAEWAEHLAGPGSRR